MKQGWGYLNYTKNGDLTWFKLERGPTYQQILCLAIVKWSFVPRLRLTNLKTLKIKIFRQPHAKSIETIAQVKKKL